MRPFATPIRYPVDVQCNQTTDLNDLFNMRRGTVTGTIRLAGPLDQNGLYPPWALSSLVRWDQFNTDGIPTGSSNPDAVFNNDYDLRNSSHVLATGGLSADSIAGGTARVLFGGSVEQGLYPDNNGSLMSVFSGGTYNLRLAALNSGGGTGSSTWDANVLHLRFLDTTTTSPEQYLNSVVEITDPAFANQTIAPNETPTHDFDYCFSEVLLMLHDTNPNHLFKNPSISGTGQRPLNGTPDYTVSMSAAGQPTDWAADGTIRLFLPRGKYTFKTTVQYDLGSANQQEFQLTVDRCGTFEVDHIPGPSVHINDVPPCLPPTVTGSVTGPYVIKEIECYVGNLLVDSSAPNSLNPDFSFTLSDLTGPGTYTILVEATDAQDYVSSYSLPFVAIADPGPIQVFNTGMAGIYGYEKLNPGDLDTNFKLLSVPPGAGTTAVVGDPQYLPSSWMPNTASSQWIGPLANPIGRSGIYHYQLKFTSCCPEKVGLAGRIAVDDTAELRWNGDLVGTVAGWTSWSPVSFTSDFTIGVNVLDIYVNNTGGGTGLRAELTNVCLYAKASPVVQPPDTSTNGLAGDATGWNLLAENFLWTGNGAVTGLELWGAWLGDDLDPDVQFMLGIWSDVPGRSQHSQPAGRVALERAVCTRRIRHGVLHPSGRPLL
jgi:hypothetical protein